MKTKSCQAPGSVGLISASLSRHVQKNACFVPAPSSKLISDPSNGAPFSFPPFQGKSRKARTPAQRVVIEPTKRTAAVLSLRAVYPCSSHERSLRVIVRSKTLLRGRNRAPK